MGVLSCGTTMLDQGVFNNIGAVTWDTTAKTSGFTAVSGNGYFCNTTSSAFTVTLPSSPSAGDIVGVKDYANTADTNNITIGRNGSNIQGQAEDFDIVKEGGSVLLVYVDGTQGWKVTSASQASDIEGTLYVAATGGTITTSGDFKIHTFTGPGTFTVTCAGNSKGSNTVDYLVLAGGGGGGHGRVPGSPDGLGGGGGAGGHRSNYPQPATGGLSITATSFPVTVGGGGSGGFQGPGNSGSNSVFSSITSAGGGYGGRGGTGPESHDGADGGSGGGGGGRGNAAGGSGNTPPVSPSQGNDGGNSQAPDGGSQAASGGGGGAGGAASNATVNNGTPGGNGTANSINASPVTRAGGGGGAGLSSSGSGGPGGGTAGVNNGASSSAAANTGSGSGGGGGGSAPQVGSGGSGIVIIRYKFQ